MDTEALRLPADHCGKHCQVCWSMDRKGKKTVLNDETQL